MDRSSERPSGDPRRRHGDDVVRRLETLGLALLAYRQLCDGEDFGRERFGRIFESDEPEEITRIWVFVGGFESVVNGLCETCVSVRKALVLTADGSSSRENAINALRGERCFPDRSANELLRLNKFRATIQHRSPSVRASDFHEQMVLALERGPVHVEQLQRYLERRGVL